MERNYGIGILLLGVFITCFPALLPAQLHYEETVLPGPFHSMGINQIGTFSSTGLFGIGIAETLWNTWEASEGKGIHLLYYFRMDSLRGSVYTSTIPDTGDVSWCASPGCWSEDHFDPYAQPAGDSTILFYRKQMIADADVLDDVLLDEPSIHAFSISNTTGQMRSLFEVQSATDPRIVVDHDGNTHFLWAKIVVADTLHERRADNYYYYRSTIYYRLKNAAGELSLPQVIDSGYFPQLCVDDSDIVHILYFAGTSSVGAPFIMKYTKGQAGSFQTSKTLATGVVAGLNRFTGKPIPVSFSVNGNGSRVHVGWTDHQIASEQQREIHSLLMIDDSVQITSTMANIGDNVSASFLYRTSDDAVFSVWNDYYSDYHSSTVNSPLFSHIDIRSPHKWQSSSDLFFIPMNRNAPSYLFMTSDTGILHIRNLETMMDSSLITVPGLTSLSGSVAIGHQEDLYVLSGRRIIHMFQGSTGVTESKIPHASTFELAQNYPNPFNPTTDVGFRMADVGYTRLKIFNVLGEEVATLVDQVKAPGEYHVRWNATGKPSGVYFYRLDAVSTSDPGKRVSQTRKMMLVR